MPPTRRWFSPTLAIVYGSLYFLGVMAVHLLFRQPALGRHRELLVVGPCYGVLMSLARPFADRLDAKIKRRFSRR